MKKNRETHQKAIEKAMQGQAEEGLALLKEAIAEANDPASLRDALALLRLAGILSEQLGDYASALKFYEQARAADPREPHIYLALMTIHTAVGDTVSAQACRDLFVTYADPVADADLVERVRGR